MAGRKADRRSVPKQTTKSAKQTKATKIKMNKIVSKIIFGMGAVFALVLADAVGGCATHNPNRQALICPDCKVMVVPIDPSILEADPSGSMSSTTTKHTCPGCQGFVKTFFKEGKLEHKCSVCAQGPFTCPISHKW
jgi:hypothetical protein